MCSRYNEDSKLTEDDLKEPINEENQHKWSQKRRDNLYTLLSAKECENRYALDKARQSNYCWLTFSKFMILFFSFIFTRYIKCFESW